MCIRDRYKGQYFDGSLRVPLLFWGPGVFRNRGVCDVNTMNFDILPTLADIAGIPLPNDIDGKSLAPFLFEANKSPVEIHDYLVWTGIQSNNQSFHTKHDYVDAPSCWVIREKDHVFRHTLNKGFELYASTDIKEEYNLYNKNAALSKGMYNKYADWFKKIPTEPLTFKGFWKEIDYRNTIVSD